MVELSFDQMMEAAAAARLKLERAKFDRLAAEAKEEARQEFAAKKARKQQLAQANAHQKPVEPRGIKREPVPDTEQTSPVQPKPLQSQPAHSTEADASPPSQSADGDEVLASWHPRKEKRTDKQRPRELFPKAKTADKPADQFVGFGHVPASQQDSESARKQSVEFKIRGAAKLRSDDDSRPSPASSKEGDETRPVSKEGDKTKHGSKEVTKTRPASKDGINTRPTEQKAPAQVTEKTVSTKRPSQSSVYGDRPSLSSLKISKRISVASPQSPGREEAPKQSINGDDRPPQWYKDTKVPNTRSSNDYAGVEILLRRLREQIAACKTALEWPERRNTARDFDLLRNMLYVKPIFETLFSLRSLLTCPQAQNHFSGGQWRTAQTTPST